ncbi:MAG: T9SS type A sorting domain-containing protein [Chitinophagaceae bacterium]|nr:T9SS type A sorting domain-containing protein [Chitinophagaceae bacterium]
MKPPRTAPIIIVLLLLLALAAKAQNKLSSVKVTVPSSLSERQEVIALLQLDHFRQANGIIYAQVGEEDLARLKMTGFKYEVLVEDIGADLEKKNKPYFEARKKGWIDIDGKPTAKGITNKVAFEQTGGLINTIIPTPSAFQVYGTFGGYYSYAQMVTAMDNLVTAYPSLVQKSSLGKSVENRDIWCIKISDNVATDESNEPEVLYMGIQHAREAIGGSSMIFFMQYLCENYGSNARIKELVDNREIYIIPCMNPDGWEYNRSTNPNGGGGWRKNRKVIRATPTPVQYGVDLNRNWGVDWANCSAPIQGSPTSCGSGTNTSATETYWGTSAFSEPETQAVRDFTLSHHLVAMIDQHAYGPYYSLPFGRPSLHNIPDSLSVVQQQFYTAIPALMGTYNAMRAGNSIQSVGYEVAGGVKDWMLKGSIGTGTKGIVYGMTGEGAAGGGSGGTYSDFWAPASQITYLCKGMCYQNLQLAYAAGSYVEVNDLGDMAVAAKTGSFNFYVRRLGLGDQPVTVSLVSIENIQTVGSPVTIPSLPNYYDTYTGSISYNLFSSLTNGQRIKFAWKVETGGYTYFDTVIKFYNPTQLLYDDMEGSFSANWTAAITPVGPTGWGFTSSVAYQGSRSMTESPSGNYTTSSTRTATYTGGTGSFDLSDATAAYLSFWVKHRAENFRDRLQVQVSTNGTTWIPVAGSTTIQEPVTFDNITINGQPSLTGIRENWTKEMFDLSAYKTFPNVRLRFQFLSDADGSGFDFELDDGFYIDNVKVIKSTATLITLPVNFLDVNSKILPGNKVQVSWKAVTDDKFSYFDVERSVDGRVFSHLGTVSASAPYILVDADPASGSNYYRIKGVDTDGQFTYSKTTAVYFDPVKFSLMVYPNPADEDVIFRFTGERTVPVTIEVSDLSGKIVYTAKTMINANSQETKINIRRWPAQTYIVKAIRNDNSYLIVQKFIKR